MSDDCSICLNSLSPGSPLLTLSCNHKYHLQCLVLSLNARNIECPLCRAPIDEKVVQLLSNNNPNEKRSQVPNLPSINRFDLPCLSSTRIRSSIEDSMDWIALPIEQAKTARCLSISPAITLSTTLEFGKQLSDEQSNIYGLVTLKARSMTNSSSLRSDIPIDLVCIIDRSASMKGEKMILLKKTLFYIIDQLNQLDRLAIISFNKQAFNLSHGLLILNENNKKIIKNRIENQINVGGGTFIGAGLQMGIDLLNQRQTNNPLSALFLFSDGVDTQKHDYFRLMHHFPSNTPCHTFGFGLHHQTDLLIKLAQFSHGGTFTYIDTSSAIGPALVTTLTALLTCVAQRISVNIHFNGEYQVTNVHSKYKYEPCQLPSSTFTFRLDDLNEDENRNLLFQFNVPKLNLSRNMSQRSMNTSRSSKNLLSRRQQLSITSKINDNNVIGHATVTYFDINIGKTLKTKDLPFLLIRTSQISQEDQQVNQIIDIQRNRIETAFILEKTVDERDYQRSEDLLQNQIQNIEQSVSGKDPFCQLLIESLRSQHPSEHHHRLVQRNASLRHHSERNTFSATDTFTTLLYQSPKQLMEINRFNENYT